MFYQYAYFIGSIILFVVWLCIYFYRKDLRKEIIFGSVIALPFGLTEIIVVPEYWSPASLFNLIERFELGVESFLFSFFVGGIAVVVFEVINKKRTTQKWFDRKIHFLPFIFFILTYLVMELFLPYLTIYNLTFSLLLGAVIIGFIRKDLIKQIIFSGIYFSVIYFFLFYIFTKLFNGYVESVYNLDNFLGIFLFGVPAEEILFAFAFGACWSVLYEYMKGYKTKPINFFDKLKNYVKN
jgi:hypothetical protein